MATSDEKSMAVELDRPEEAQPEVKATATELEALPQNQGMTEIKGADAERAARVDAIWKQLKEKTQADIKKTARSNATWNLYASRMPTGVTSALNLDVAGDVVFPPTVTQPKSKPEESTDEAGEEIPETSSEIPKKRSRPSGVDAVLASLQKKKKVTVLDRGKEGWQAFKEEHTADADVLEAHRRSTEQYLEKQQFLNKAAMNEHQAEIQRKHNRTQE